MGKRVRNGNLKFPSSAIKMVRVNSLIKEILRSAFATDGVKLDVIEVTKKPALATRQDAIPQYNNNLDQQFHAMLGISNKHLRIFQLLLDCCA
jgi:hypothetical protein